MSVSTATMAGPALAAFRPGHAPLLVGLVAVRTMTGTETWDSTYKPVQCVDPGGSARQINLPPEAEGLGFWISNKADAAETITVKEDAGSVTIETVDQNESLLLWCDGTTWLVIDILTKTIT